MAPLIEGINMLTLYVYSTETNKLVARIEGDSNGACEAVAAQEYGDTDVFGWTYSPAFGTNDGILPGDDVVDLTA